MPLTARLDQGSALDLGDLHRRWKWTLLRGLLALVLGAVAILFPLAAVFALTLAFAAFAFVDGILSLATGLGATTRCDDPRWPYYVRGIIGLIIGVVFVAMPILSTVAYAMVTLGLIAAWAIISGLLEISAGVRLRRQIEGEWMLIGSGALSVLLGVAIPIALIADPLSFVALAWIVGIYALAAGGALVMQGLRLRWIDGLGDSDPAPPPVTAPRP